MFNGLRPTLTLPPPQVEGGHTIPHEVYPPPRPPQHGVSSLSGPTRRIRYLEQSVIELFRRFNGRLF